MLRFETYVRYGNRWAYRGEIEAHDGRGAALIRGYLAQRRVIGTRPAGSLIALQVHRFGFTPELHHGR